MAIFCPSRKADFLHGERKAVSNPAKMTALKEMLNAT
jgi:hypothetical protein